VTCSLNILKSSEIHSGLPIFLSIGIVVIAMGLSYFSNHIFEREMKSIYGIQLAQLERALMDFEELG